MASSWCVCFRIGILHQLRPIDWTLFACRNPQGIRDHILFIFWRFFWGFFLEVNSLTGIYDPKLLSLCFVLFLSCKNEFTTGQGHTYNKKTEGAESYWVLRVISFILKPIRHKVIFVLVCNRYPFPPSNVGQLFNRDHVSRMLGPIVGWER